MYTKAKEAAKYRSTKPSLTDQSQADDTNLNIIIKKFGITGKAPGGKLPIPAGDYTNAPEDLRGHIELQRSVKELQTKLPKHLQNLTPEQLAKLDNKQLAIYNAILEKQTMEQSNADTTKQSEKPSDKNTPSETSPSGVPNSKT